MRTIEGPDDDLDLPPLDGEGHDDVDAEVDAEDELDVGTDDDALDDATGESDPLEEIAVEGAEGGWLLDAEDNAGLDVGPFDLSLSAEGRLLEDDEPDGRPADDDLGISADETVAADGGEEGPTDEDEELREEDLPALDADEEGDVDDAGLFDRSVLSADEELRWEDRAWARVDAAEHATDELEDSGMLAVPGESPEHGLRDATWRRLDEGGLISAAALVPGESVIVALDRLSVTAPGRPVLVRILPDGAARIIAEIEVPASDNDAATVLALRWDAARGCIVALGSFGSQAFRPR